MDRLINVIGGREDEMNRLLTVNSYRITVRANDILVIVRFNKLKL